MPQLDTGGPGQASQPWHSSFQAGWGTHRKQREGRQMFITTTGFLEACLRPAAATPHMAVSSQGMSALRWYWFASMGPSWERLRSMLQFHLS